MGCSPELSPKLIHALLDNAAPHFRAQLIVLHATGARVSSVLYGCRLCDLILAPGRERLTFHDTKSGQSVTSVLTPFAAAELQRYLAWRGRLDDREGPLFLTAAREPYADNAKKYGGQTKAAWQGMRRRAAKSLIDAATAAAAEFRAASDVTEANRVLAEAQAEADLLNQVTPHWLRHNLATTMFASGASVREVMDQGGWLEAGSALIYGHDVPETRRQHVRAALDLETKIDTPLDTPPPGAAEKRR
jgi:site-specific recombinase XerD